MCTCVISDWPSLKAYWGMKKSHHTHNAFFLGSLRNTRLETEMGMCSENHSLESASYHFQK